MCLQMQSLVYSSSDCKSVVHPCTVCTYVHEYVQCVFAFVCMYDSYVCTRCWKSSVIFKFIIMQYILTD